MTEHILIAYFSRSGNTRKIATLIQQEVGGTLHEIQVETPYPDAYNAVVEQAKQEIHAGYKPALRSTLDHIEAYDTIFVGSPNWWSTIAPPVAAFLAGHNFAGKTIVPFCTHGGGGLDKVAQDMAKLCPQATILGSLEVYGSGSGDVRAKVSAWLRKVGL
ncbi:MAG: NAD(P)H-dependent oxidoreductase [Anaerolineae bacterium]|nr:NAD(P)H-dependent oxidoreductase [Anaerolineae bacterium]